LIVVVIKIVDPIDEMMFHVV